MANHVSALKRARQSLVRRDRNRATRSKVRNLIKKVRVACDAGDAEQAQVALKTAVPAIYKAAGKGVWHANKASRKVSRLTRQVNAVSA